MFNNKPAILFLDRAGFDFYGSNFTDVLHFDLTQFSANLEIYNREALDAQLKSFIEKILPSDLYIVLAESTLFLKAFDSNKDTEAIEKYINSVPFEHVASKSYNVDAGVLIVATNKDFYGVIKYAFENNGFRVQAVTPVILTGITIESGFDVGIGNMLLGGIVNLKQNNFDQTAIHGTSSKTTQENAKKTDKKRLILLAAVFGILIVILIIVAIINFMPQTAPQKPLPLQAFPTNVPTPVVTQLSLPTQQASPSGF